MATKKVCDLCNTPLTKGDNDINYCELIRNKSKNKKEMVMYVFFAESGCKNISELVDEKHNDVCRLCYNKIIKKIAKALVVDEL